MVTKDLVCFPCHFERLTLWTLIGLAANILGFKKSSGGFPVEVVDAPYGNDQILGDCTEELSASHLGLLSVSPPGPSWTLASTLTGPHSIG